MRLSRLTAPFLALLLAAGCTQPSTGTSGASAPGTENPRQCITDYREGVDYFPDKTTFDKAKGITVEYHDSYKVVHETEPLKGAKSQSFVLLQCGAPTPKLEGDLASAKVIEVPTAKVATSSTTQLPAFEILGKIDAIAGVENTDYVYSPEIKKAIEAGKISGYGNAAGEISVEKVGALQPDVFVASGTPNPAYDSISELGIPVIGNAEWLESSPLGRAEWLKLTALLTNTEAEANKKFATIVADYEKTAKLTRSVTSKPSVVTGAPYKGQWYRSGGQSYIARFLADAGAEYVFAKVPGTGSSPVDLEVILAEASDAQFWINATTTSEWKSVSDVVASDSRLSELKATKLSNVWNPTLRVGDKGGNDYWQTGVVRPDQVLADMVAIFHPDLLPDHKFVFYQKLS